MIDSYFIALLTSAPEFKVAATGGVVDF